MTDHKIKVYIVNKFGLIRTFLNGAKDVITSRALCSILQLQYLVCVVYLGDHFVWTRFLLTISFK